MYLLDNAILYRNFTKKNVLYFPYFSSTHWLIALSRVNETRTEHFRSHKIVEKLHNCELYTRCNSCYYGRTKKRMQRSRRTVESPYTPDIFRCIRQLFRRPSVRRRVKKKRTVPYFPISTRNSRSVSRVCLVYEITNCIVAEGRGGDRCEAVTWILLVTTL